MSGGDEFPWMLRLEEFKGGGGYRGRVDELPGCEIDLPGATFSEALEALRKKVAEWVARAEREGIPLPPPKVSPEDEAVRLKAIVNWFLLRGYRLEFSEERDDVWTNLVSAETGEEVAPRYGRGSSRMEAAVRAIHRHKQEQ